MSAPLIEFFKTLEPVERARMFVTYARLLGIIVRNALMAFDHGSDR